MWGLNTALFSLKVVFHDLCSLNISNTESFLINFLLQAWNWEAKPSANIYWPDIWGGIEFPLWLIVHLFTVHWSTLHREREYAHWKSGRNSINWILFNKCLFCCVLVPNMVDLIGIFLPERSKPVIELVSSN